MYTQCPQCLTYFQVTPEHLRIAQGNVRCINRFEPTVGNILDRPPTTIRGTCAGDGEATAASVVEYDAAGGIIRACALEGYAAWPNRGVGEADCGAAGGTGRVAGASDSYRASIVGKQTRPITTAHGQ